MPCKAWVDLFVIDELVLYSPALRRGYGVKRMIYRPQSDLPMSFTSATPELLVRFRHKLGDADMEVWHRNAHLLWASEFIEAFAGRTLCSISYEEIQRFLNRIEAHHNLNGEKRKEIISSLSVLYREIDGIEPPWGTRAVSYTHLTLPTR